MAIARDFQTPAPAFPKHPRSEVPVQVSPRV